MYVVKDKHTDVPPHGGHCEATQVTVDSTSISTTVRVTREEKFTTTCNQLNIVVMMQRFGNLKGGSVFSFLHPETAVWVSVFQKKKFFFFFFFEN